MKYIGFENIMDRSSKDNCINWLLQGLFKKIYTDCQHVYNFGGFLTIAEILGPFGGKCSFYLFILNKPANNRLQYLL